MCTFTVVEPAELTVNQVNGDWGSVQLHPTPAVSEPPEYIFGVGTEVVLTAEPNEPRGFRHWVIYDPNFPGLDANAVFDSNRTTKIVVDTDRQVKAVFTCGNDPTPLVLLTLGVVGLVALVRWMR
jgi:hypothetical protein